MISIVVPCYNETEVIDELYERLTQAAEKWHEPFEVIIVDDGSREDFWQKLAMIHSKDSRWKALRFSRNFGHQTAVSAGLYHADGDAVIVIDGDLQDPPEELYRFIDKWKEGYDVVFAIRQKRKENIFKRGCYKLFYRILSGASETLIPEDAGDFALIDRKVLQVINAMPEENRFVRGLRAWSGFRQTGLAYERQARAGGAPKYSFAKLVQLAIDGIFSFSAAPLRLATKLGLLTSAVSLAGAVFTFLQRIFADQFLKIGLAPVPGFATIVIAMLFLGGVQLICLGILGEYIGRIYDEVKQRPSWVIQEGLGIEFTGKTVKDMQSRQGDA